MCVCVCQIWSRSDHRRRRVYAWKDTHTHARTHARTHTLLYIYIYILYIYIYIYNIHIYIMLYCLIKHLCYLTIFAEVPHIFSFTLDLLDILVHTSPYILQILSPRLQLCTNIVHKKDIRPIRMIHCKKAKK